MGTDIDKNSPVVVLGGFGRLGCAVMPQAKAAGLNWRSQSRQNGNADIIWSGRFDDPACDTALPAGGTVINLIGATQGTARHMTDLNLSFVQTLLKEAQARGVAHVILASSAAVYGQSTGQPLRETDVPQPVTPYGESKLAMEHAARDNTAQHSAHPAISLLRIGNVAGADTLLSAAQRHEAKDEPMPLHRFANGQAALRSYIGPVDLFRVLAAVVGHGTGVGTLNVAQPNPVRLDALLQAYRQHLLPDLRWIDSPAPPGIPPEVVLDVTALSKIIQIPMANSADALARQLADRGTYETTV